MYILSADECVFSTHPPLLMHSKVPCPWARSHLCSKHSISPLPRSQTLSRGLGNGPPRPRTEPRPQRENRLRSDLRAGQVRSQSPAGSKTARSTSSPRADSARTSLTVTSNSLRMGGATEEEGVAQEEDVLGSAGGAPGESTVDTRVPALLLCSSFCFLLFFFFLTWTNLQHFVSSLIFYM